MAATLAKDQVKLLQFTQVLIRSPQARLPGPLVVLVTARGLRRYILVMSRLMTGTETGTGTISGGAAVRTLIFRSHEVRVAAVVGNAKIGRGPTLSIVTYGSESA